jgi:hypothetical protein
MLRAIIPESIWRIFRLSFWIDIFHRRTNPPPISPFAISLWTLLRHHHIWKNVKVASFSSPSKHNCYWWYTWPKQISLVSAKERNLKMNQREYLYEIQSSLKYDNGKY